MPIKPQPLPIQFAGGVETKQDAKQVPSTRLLVLENATFIKQTTLAKRNGYEALSRLIDGGSSEYADPIGLAQRDDELLLFTDERCYSHRPSVDRWADVGEVASVEATDPPIARTGTNQTMPDHATNEGVTVVAWEDSRDGVYCSVIEAETGRILLAETELDSLGISPRVVRCGTVLHVYWARAASSRIYVAVINPASPATTPTPSILVDDLSSTNPAYDGCDVLGLYSLINPALLAWASTSGGYRVGYVHPSGVLGSPATGLPSVATWADSVTGPIAVTYDRLTGDHIYVAWANTLPYMRSVPYNALSTETATGALSATSATWNRLTLELVGYTAAGNFSLWWAGEIDGSTDDLNRIESGQVDHLATIITAARTLRGHVLVGRAFRDNEHCYALVGHAVPFFSYAVVVRLSGDEFGGDAVTQGYYRSVVTQFPGAGARKHLASVQYVDIDLTADASEDPGNVYAGPGSLDFSQVLWPRKHAFCLGYRIQVDSEDADTFGEVGIKLVTVDYSSDSAYQSAQLGRGLYLAGACMSHYDGRRWAEAGYHTAPDCVLDPPLAEGSAGALDAGLYLYRAVYEEIDALGELHQSSPSVAWEVTIAASKRIDVTLPTYRLTSKRRLRIGVYRSPVNSTGTLDVIPFYRVTSLDPDATGANGYVVNDPTVDTIDFVDNMPDSALITKEPLYTNGGILANVPSPTRGDVIAGGKSRLYTTDPTQGNWIRYTQEIADDTGLEAPIVLANQCDPYGGRVVGIGAMDGAIFGFCETAIYGFGGPGPLRNPNAGSEAFSPPELITSDVGCKSPNSICQSPVGIVFQSEKGIKLLNRSRQVEDIGAAVYAYNAQTITRATLLPDRHQIVFLTDDGNTLLYNYGAGPGDPSAGQWSTFTNHEGIDARVVGGVYHYLRNDGRVFKETPAAYLDDNAQIVMRIETAWIKMLPYLQGWQRILWAYFLGEHKSEHTLVIRYRIDYNLGYSAPINLDVNSNFDPDLYGAGPYGAGAYGGGGGDTSRYQRAIHFNLPCQAIQFRIEDSEATGDAGPSFELSELLLVGGVLDSRFKPGPSRTN
jgi:hypothetical protein